MFHEKVEQHGEEVAANDCWVNWSVDINVICGWFHLLRPKRN